MMSSLLKRIHNIWAIVNQGIFVGERYEKNIRQISVVNLIVFVLGIVFSFVNFFQKDSMISSALLFAVASAISFYFLRIRGKRSPAVIVLVSAVLMVLTYDVVINPNGFAFLWTLLVPVFFGFFVDIKAGIFLTLYFQVLFSVSFSPGLRGSIPPVYPQLVLDRFPLYYFFFSLIIIYVMFLYHRSILEDMEYEKKLKEEVQKQIQASQAKRNFIANMSHEIRTPIHAILGMDEMLLREVEDPEYLEYAMNIHRAGTALLYQINDVLDFSKIEAGRMTLVPEEYLPADIFRDMQMMMETRAREKGIDFVMDIDPAIPHILYGDSVRIRQIILNLLTNAVKYTPEGGVTLRVSVEKLPGEEVELGFVVKDTGIGIRREDIKDLFAMYSRFDESRNHHIEGTGLGMSIVLNLLKLMDSELSIDSERGKGSVFSFKIRQPVISWIPEADSATVVQAEETSYRALFTAPKVRVLLVDDTEMNLLVTKGLLKKTRVIIDTASNGQEGLELSEKREYDILLIDHRMPIMDGIELIHRLRESPSNPNRHKPCLLLTANNLSGFREEALEAGYDDFLVKPISGIQMEQALAQYLPSEKLHREDGVKARETAPGETPAMEEDSDLSGYVRMGLNVADGLDYAGEKEMYLAALELFAGSAEKKIKEIRDCYEGENWQDYQTRVHGLKSSARIIGAAELSEEARRLEIAAQRGDLETIRTHTAKTVEDYRTLAENLKAAAPQL